MTSDVEDLAPPRDDDAEPLSSASSASSEWLATVAVGLSIVTSAAAVWLALAIGGEGIRDAINTLVRTNAADVAVTFAFLNDGATLLMLLGLVFVTRREPMEMRGSTTLSWVACLALVAACVGDHVVATTQTFSNRRLSFGVDGDTTWQNFVVDGRHLAWALAIAVTLAHVANFARRDGLRTLARRATFAAAAWPVLAAGVIVASHATEMLLGPSIDPRAELPWLMLTTLEGAIIFVTLAIVVRIERRLFGAWRVARRRVEVPRPRGDACVRCAYDLRGIADGSACPECGLLAGRSRTPTTAHLRDASPAWLRGIAVGVAMILIAELVGAGWPFAFDAVVWPNIVRNPAFVQLPGPGQGPRFFGIPVDVNLLFHAPLFLAAILLFVGVWLLTRPQRNGARDSVLCGTMRAFAVIPFVAFGLTCWNARPSASRNAFATQLAALALLTVGCAPLPALTFALLRRLARRVLNANLAEHATIVGVGFSVTLVAIPLVAIVLSIGNGHGDSIWSGRSDVPMYLLAAVAVSLILFAGWSALNCLRFTIAFARAYQEAQRVWDEADRRADR